MADNGKFTARDLIEFEDLTGLPFMDLNKDHIPLKAAAAIVFLYERKTDAGVTYEGVLDADLDDLLKRAEAAGDAMHGGGAANPPEPEASKS